MGESDPLVRGGQEGTISAEEFMAMICRDEELLRAEFDAIVAAGWDEPPTSPTVPSAGSSLAPPRGEFPAPWPLGGFRWRGLSIWAWARQRSPPPSR